MITGTVKAGLEATVLLTVLDSDGYQYPIEFGIDTGFNMDLSLPPAVIAVLGLPWIASVQAVFGDGSVRTVDIYDATITWDGHPRAVKVIAADSKPLLGMRVLRDHELRVVVRPGGTVTIQPIP